jgi:hypothetical protein
VAASAGAEPVEDQGQLVFRDAAAAVGDDQPYRGSRLTPDDRQLYGIALGGMPDGVVKERVKGKAEPVGVGWQGDAVEAAKPPAARCRRLPAVEELRQEQVKGDGLGLEELGVGGRGDQEQALRAPAQPVQLADHDVDVLQFLADGGRVPGQAGGQQFRVAEGNGDESAAATFLWGNAQVR